MSETETSANIEPVRLGSESRFKFKCHPGVECFTKCCRDINIILTPYDVIRLKNRLELSSEEFLALYTEPQMLEKTGLPVVTLKFLPEEDKDSDGKLCPFVRENGCCLKKAILNSGLMAKDKHVRPARTSGLRRRVKMIWF